MQGMCYQSYSAGIVDGEGSIIIGKNKQKNGRIYYVFSIAISMQDEGPIKFIANSFGLHYWKHRDKRHKKTYYVIDCGSIKGENFLNEIIPHLRGKKDQAELALEFIQFKRNKKKYYTEPGKDRIFKSQHVKHNRIISPTKVLNEEYFKKCEEFYQKCKQLKIRN